MKRKNIRQITNTKWFPDFLTRCIHEFMTWFVHKVKAAKPFMPVLEEGLQHTDRIIVIDKKGGAGFETLKVFLDEDIKIVHVDSDAFEANETGLYVSVNSFHQFDEDKAKSILKKVASKQQPIAILEGNNDSLWQVFGMTVIVPLTVILTAPFVKPFRFERLFFTYLIPILPLVTFLDGFIALFKLYAPDDLDELTATIDVENYMWRSGKMDNGRGGKIIYLIGHPQK
ncbi:hypothetical protein [Winogradskyella aurantia]|uniref:Methyltransferase type 11 n=1 Tax=Winogradskyella aurantia TaxID=1915063 RepID=A0A265UXV8_9FLAO|nr:hypothetical protein [Winogradskyella aurantia]OZV70130.1 hypothetical protein CA834_05810 [Winogradskyella aurantia]